MNKIEIKRVYRENAPAYYFQDKYYDQSKFIIEVKLLSELQESDKEKLNIFLTQVLINKGIINHGHLYGWQYITFDFNLEEINKKINKITNITKVLSNDGFKHCSNCSCSRCNKLMFYNYENKHKHKHITYNYDLNYTEETEINKLNKDIEILNKECDIITILKKEIDK